MDIYPYPAMAVPEASSIVTTVTENETLETTEEEIPGYTTTVGYVLSPAMVMGGQVVDATAHPVTFPIFMAVAGDAGEASDFDPTPYLAVWDSESESAGSGTWLAYYRSLALERKVSLLFDPVPEREDAFAVWADGTLKEGPAVVLSEGVSGRASSFPGNALLMALVLGEERSDASNGLFSWRLNPAVQVMVSNEGEVQALYGTSVIASTQVFAPLTARPLVVAAAVIDRAMVLAVCDGTTRVARARLPRDAQFALEAPLYIGQVELDDEITYSDLALLRVGMARVAEERQLVAMVTDMAAEYGVRFMP
jgi:hypothetical protein